MGKELSRNYYWTKERITKAGISVLEIWSLILAACGPVKATEKVTPTGESVDSAKTLIVEPPTQTMTYGPTETLTPTVSPTLGIDNLNNQEDGGELELTGPEIEKKIPATQILIIKYHYPGYSEAGVTQTEELFAAQLDFLAENGYKTVTDQELSLFLEGKLFLPARSIALEADQQVTGYLRDKGFTTITNKYDLPVIDPSVLVSTLNVLKANLRNNPLSIPLLGGYTFDNLLLLNSTPITADEIQEVTKKPCEPIFFGNYMEVPSDPRLEGGWSDR